jgi:outer membrane protein assembly factor BamB
MRARPFQILLAAASVGLFAAADWRQFRGTNGKNVAPDESLPLQFDERHNVAWKAPLPGRGPSGPIVVGGRVFVTASSGPREDRLHLLCFDAQTGQRRWERQLWATGHTSVHPFGANAAPTPASDGRLVFAFYSSNDLACFDLDGNLQWFRGLAHDDPVVRNDVGMASSPLVLGEILIVQLDTPVASFVAGIDKQKGTTRWRLDREKGAMWSSPTVLPGKTREEDIALFQGRNRLAGHDPRTGELLFEYEASCHSIASVTTDGNCAYLPSHGLHALRYDPTSREVELLWHEPRLRSGNPSPIVHNGRAYTLKSPAILVCGDATDGKVLWQLRLKAEGQQWSSPVIAGNHLYLVNYAGLVQVVELGEQGKLLEETSQIDPKILATPAVADGAIYFRSDRHLWKVAAD